MSLKVEFDGSDCLPLIDLMLFPARPGWHIVIYVARRRIVSLRQTYRTKQEARRDMRKLRREFVEQSELSASAATLPPDKLPDAYKVCCILKQCLAAIQKAEPA